jgi:hypothetical protein
MKDRSRTAPGALFPNTPAPEIPAFGTGEVAQILDLPIWRVQKFLDSPKYNLSPEGQLGSGGHGSRRVFTADDIFRIAIAARMVQDGFAAKFVGSILELIEDLELSWSHDQEGIDVPPPDLLTLKRAAKGPVPKLFHSDKPPKLGEKDSPYYVLNLDEIKHGVDKGIARLKK